MIERDIKKMLAHPTTFNGLAVEIVYPGTAVGPADDGGESIIVNHGEMAVHRHKIYMTKQDWDRVKAVARSVGSGMR